MDPKETQTGSYFKTSHYYNIVQAALPLVTLKEKNMTETPTTPKKVSTKKKVTPAAQAAQPGILMEKLVGDANKTAGVTSSDIKEFLQNLEVVKPKVMPSAVIKAKTKPPAPESVIAAAETPASTGTAPSTLPVNSDLPMEGREHQTAFVFDIRRGVTPLFSNRIERMIQSLNGDQIKSHIYTLGGNKAGTGAALVKKTPTNYAAPNVEAQVIDLEKWGRDVGFTMVAVVISTGV